MMKIKINEKAYETEDGPVLLLAGPGTGKTYQIAKRIQYLTNKGVSPEEITVITFTKEAAISMRRKISEEGCNEYIETNKRPNRIVTMHSLGHKIIEENCTDVGLKKGFGVAESTLIRKGLIRDAALLLDLGEAEAKVAFEERTKSVEKLLSSSKAILKKYEEILRFCNFIDFDDQINLACKILEKNNKVKSQYSSLCKYLLIDEYQDINRAQNNFIKLLSSNNLKGVFAVGDDDQSIYSFRGGKPEYIRNFETDYPNASIFQLQTSRRCKPNILDCAISVVENSDPERLPKVPPIYLEKEKGVVEVYSCPSDDYEAKMIANSIKKEIAKNKKIEIFVLIPNKLYFEKIKNALKNLNICFDSQFENQDKSWSKIILAKEIITESKIDIDFRGVLEKMIDFNLLDIPSEKVKLPSKKNERKTKLKKIANIWEKSISSNKTFQDMFKGETSDTFIKDINLLIQSIIDSSNLGLSSYISKILDVFKPWPSIEKFYEELNKVLEPKTKGTNNVRILTLQNSKGLEADIVFVTGLEEKQIKKEDYFENLRLIFVAMTRAKTKLQLFWARKRSGSATFKINSYALKPSKFISNLPKNKYKPLWCKSKK